MRVEVVAVGTELLLGQIADTNSAWLGEQMAAAGIDSHFHQAVGDNHRRIVLALRTALARSDGVIICGGLGPTQDDITREAIAEVMNVALKRDQAIEDRIAAFFASRGRQMTDNNARQADVPEGATVIEQTRGTAPGLLCPLGRKVVYAVPGVPYEMAEMFDRAILPDLRRRAAEAGEEAVIVSRVLRTWGTSESEVAEALDTRLAAQDGAPFPAPDPATAATAGAAGTAGTAPGGTAPANRPSLTIAFLASGIEGLKVRLTARAPTEAAAAALLDAEEREVRAALTASFGDVVFGVDDQSMERAVADLLGHRGLSLGLAESLTGGLMASRLVDVPGASEWFRGAVVSYATEVKQSVLDVPPGPVVSDTAAAAMADGARRVLGSDIGLGITGVAGPDPQEGQPVGTVFVGLSRSGRPTSTTRLRLPGDRPRVRQFATISALDLLRRALLAEG